MNVVGPIISSFTNSSEDKDEALSGSGVESGESDTDRVRLEEDLVASGKLVNKLQHDLSNQLKVFYPIINLFQLSFLCIKTEFAFEMLLVLVHALRCM